MAGLLGKSSIGDPDALSLVGHHLGGDINEQTAFRTDHLTGTFSTMHQDETMNSLRSIAFFQSNLTFENAMTMMSKNRCCQLWG